MRLLSMRCAVLVVTISVAGGALVAGCTPPEQQGSATSRVSAWVSDSSIGETIGTLQGDNAHIGTAQAEHLGPNPLHTVCAVLENDASNADATLPAPDSQINSDLSAAYQAELAAANECFNGASGGTRLLAESSSERDRADALLGAALARIVEITGKTPSTTTTTEAGGDSVGF